MRDSYPTEPIGGGNPYYRCIACKKSDPEISISGHSASCSWLREQKEKERTDKLEEEFEALLTRLMHPFGKDRSSNVFVVKDGDPGADGVQWYVGQINHLQGFDVGVRATTKGEATVMALTQLSKKAVTLIEQIRERVCRPEDDGDILKALDRLKVPHPKQGETILATCPNCTPLEGARVSTKVESDGHARCLTCDADCGTANENEE